MNAEQLHPMDKVHAIAMTGSQLAMVIYAIRWWGNNAKSHPDLAPKAYEAAKLIKEITTDIDAELKAELFRHEILK